MADSPDARLAGVQDSPTVTPAAAQTSIPRGLLQKTVLSEKSARQVLIPPKIWHLSLNIGKVDAVDVRSFFPVGYARPHEIAGTFG